MSVKSLLQQISDEVKVIVDPSFNIEVFRTSLVPSTNDNNLTFTNFDSKNKKTKLLESCVLFIDIRKSTQISLQHHPKTLSKLYSSFIRSMIIASEHFGGKVRNIVGDRIMVLFDSPDCVKKAINTATLLNTVSSKIINRHFRKNDIKCGIGIDYGKMLVVKTGTIKRGIENQDYKSLVWLGKPANIASKLTDTANKDFHKRKFKVKLKTFISPLVSGLSDIFPGNINKSNLQSSEKYYVAEKIVEEEEFIKNIGWSKITNQPNYSYSTLESFEVIEDKYSTPPILITDTVYQLLKKNHPKEESIKNSWWKKQKTYIKEVDEDIFGANIFYTVIKEIK